MISVACYILCVNPCHRLNQRTVGFEIFVKMLHVRNCFFVQEMSKM